MTHNLTDAASTATGAAGPSRAWAPLAGVKVLDFSVLFPGPLTTVILADLGAEVVKIEPPAGDPARTMLPGVFARVNRNKRSVVLDLKDAGDRAEAQRLARWADVAVEAFRPGVADRLGIGFDDLVQVNPRLVYCSLSGYGQDGPWRDRPGHDLNYLAASGALAFPGHWGRKPGRSSLPLADIAGGAFAATAVLAALRERDTTGRAVRLDLSLFESALFCSAMRHGLDAEPDATLVPGNDAFETADGHMITLALVEDHFWHAFRDLVGPSAPALAQPMFDTLAGRREHAQELSRMLAEVVKARTAALWLAQLQGSDVPFELCVTPREAAYSEHVVARGRVAAHEGACYVPFPVTADGAARPAIRRLAPRLGESTLEVLAHGRAAMPDQTSTHTIMGEGA